MNRTEEKAPAAAGVNILLFAKRKACRTPEPALAEAAKC
jgi:hypothetical protein